MALYVNTNASSLNAQRMMANSTNALDTSYKRLASGLRINSAKDDAAGLQISDRLTSQINGLNQGNRNAQDGISYAQTAEGAMDEMTNMYQRIRTLALQSANGTNSQADRDALQQEVESLCCEIQRISVDTTFGGQKILNGSAASVDFQVGADANQKITLNFGATAKKAKDGTSAAALNGNWGIDHLMTQIGLKSDATEGLAATKKGTKTITASIDGANTSIKVFDISNVDKAQKPDPRYRLRLRDCGHDPAEHYPAGLPVHSEPGQPETAGSSESPGIITGSRYAGGTRVPPFCV